MWYWVMYIQVGVYKSKRGSYIAFMMMSRGRGLFGICAGGSPAIGRMMAGVLLLYTLCTSKTWNIIQ